MRGTFFGLEIGRTGLSTAQFGLDVTGHNIGNVDTAGFTRQRVVSTAYDPFSNIGKFAPSGQALVGGGVRVQILDQIRSAYLDRRFRTETTAHSYWETRSQRLSYIQSFFDNVNEKTSINHSMAEFFGSMKLLEQDPVSSSSRTLVRTSAMDFVQQLNMIYSGLIDLQKSEDKAVETKTGDINRITNDITELNKQIYVYEVTGLIANDLRDKRNLLVDQLSTLIDIEYEEYREAGTDNSLFKIKTAGVTLVDHRWAAELGTRKVDNVIPGEEQVFEVYWKKLIEDRPDTDYAEYPDYEGRALDWSKITGGELMAHINVRDGNEWRPTAAWTDGPAGMEAEEGWYGTEKTTDNRYRGIPYYIEMVNDLARALVKEVNEVHRQGWTDNPLGSQTGVNFFHEDPSWVTWTNASGIEFTWDEAAGAWTYDDGTVTHAIMQNERGEYVNAVTGDLVTDWYRVLDISQITAKNFDISAEIKETEWNIACSSMPIDRAASGGPEMTQRHNNENIQKMYDLFRKNITIIVDGSDRDIGTFDDYGSKIRLDLGSTLHTAQQTTETNRILKLSAENQRTAVAGVSLDEEMVGMIRYQHAYNGAARVITAMDDALDRLINGTGRVGL